jgi:Tfp pilus assembly protein FimT
MAKRAERNRQSGFTFVEVIIVVVVAIVVMALTIPDMTNTIYNVRLRSSANTVSGMLQATRMQAVKDNKDYYLCSGLVGSSTILWVTPTSSCPTPGSQNTKAQLSGSVSTLSAAAAPGNLPSTLGFSAIVQSSYSSPVAAFNARGLPCSSSGSICATSVTSGGSSQAVGYLGYLTATRPFGPDGWAAVSVSPAGRIQIWIWNAGWVRD